MFYLQRDKDSAYRGGWGPEMGGTVEGKNKADSQEQRKSPSLLQSITLLTGDLQGS